MEINGIFIQEEEKSIKDKAFIRLKQLQLLIKKESYINNLCKQIY